MALGNLSKHLRIILQTTTCLNFNNICQSVPKLLDITFLKGSRLIRHRKIIDQRWFRAL